MNWNFKTQSHFELKNETLCLEKVKMGHSDHFKTVLSSHVSNWEIHWNPNFSREQLRSGQISIFYRKIVSSENPLPALDKAFEGKGLGACPLPLRPYTPRWLSFAVERSFCKALWDHADGCCTNASCRIGDISPSLQRSLLLLHFL